MICIGCGNNMPDNFNFCKICGKPLVIKQAQPDSPAEEKAGETRTLEKLPALSPEQIAADVDMGGIKKTVVEATTGDDDFRLPAMSPEEVAISVDMGMKNITDDGDEASGETEMSAVEDEAIASGDPVQTEAINTVVFDEPLFEVDAPVIANVSIPVPPMHTEDCGEDETASAIKESDCMDSDADARCTAAEEVAPVCSVCGEQGIPGRNFCMLCGNPLVIPVPVIENPYVDVIEIPPETEMTDSGKENEITCPAENGAVSVNTEEVLPDDENDAPIPVENDDEAKYGEQKAESEDSIQADDSPAHVMPTPGQDYSTLAFCPRCGRERIEKFNFCGGCGFAFVRHSENECSVCGKPFGPGTQFCAGCGNKLN